MTAPKGTAPFTSPESLATEQEWNSLIIRLVDSLGSDWELRKSVTIEEAYGPNDICFSFKGDPTTENPDPGFLFYKGKPAGVFEAKYQKTNANACERAFKFLPFISMNKLPDKNYFVFFGGEGFARNDKGHIPSAPGVTYFKTAALNTAFNANDQDKILLEEKVTEEFHKLVERTVKLFENRAKVDNMVEEVLESGRQERDEPAASFSP